MTRSVHYIKIFVIAAWFYFLGWFTTPFGRIDLAKFLHPGLWWLVKAGAAILFLFMLVAVFRQNRNRVSHFQMIVTIPQIGILLLPILYFPQAIKSQLSTDAFEKRSVNPTTRCMPNSNAQGLPFPSLEEAEAIIAKNKENQLVSFQKLILGSNAYLGKEADITCMVHLDENLPPDTFACFRFQISCCAADATPVGVFTGYGETEILKQGEWVRVRGKIDQMDMDGFPVPKVIAKAIDHVPQPENPYVF